MDQQRKEAIAKVVAMPCLHSYELEDAAREINLAKEEEVIEKIVSRYGVASESRSNKLANVGQCSQA